MKIAAALIVATMSLCLAGCPAEEKKDTKPTTAGATSAGPTKPAGSASAGW